MDLSLDADILRIPAGPGALHVERYGHGGEAVVLLHGFGTSSFLWRGVAPLLARAGHTAFAVDLMGYGEADRPLDGDFSIAAQVDVKPGNVLPTVATFSTRRPGTTRPSTAAAITSR